jgi:serine protease AprX
MVGIIVQKIGNDNAVEERVAQLGGTVTKDLHIINAFAAELPAGAIPDLATFPDVRWVSLDAPMVKTNCSQCIDTTNLVNACIKAIRADQVWNTAPYLQGQGIGVAVVDSGVNLHSDLLLWQNRVVASVAYHNGWNPTTFDIFGHGTHIAGIIGGNGFQSGRKYIGVAPKANIINVKVSDDMSQGSGTASSVVEGLQWIYDNQAAYNIKVVNLSLNSTVAESYHVSPIDAAVEILWFNRIVVVTSAGNHGTGALYPPANDPFVITVGAVDDRGTNSISDDVIPAFSAYGTTSDGFAKPDLVAPGRNIVSLMTSVSSGLAEDHPGHVVDSHHFRMSGTSMSAPMVAAAAALLLQDEPNLTPDQVKYRLKATANQSWPGYDATKAGAGYLDAYAAVHAPLPSPFKGCL